MPRQVAQVPIALRHPKIIAVVSNQVLFKKKVLLDKILNPALALYRRDIHGLFRMDISRKHTDDIRMLTSDYGDNFETRNIGQLLYGFHCHFDARTTVLIYQKSRFV